MAKLFGAIIGVVFAVVLVSFLLSWPLMWLWNNCLVSAVEGVHQVGWLQMWGITLLFNSLFKTTTNTKKD